MVSSPVALFHRPTPPQLEDKWRSLVLYGRNVASYKFALAKSLLELSSQPDGLIPLGALADPFARHVSEHLKTADKQATSASSSLLDACRKFNAGEADLDTLRASTVQLGFNNVIVAGHDELGDVDHFFPHALEPFGVAQPVDGVWSLVLACKSCNRGPGGKFDRIPALRFLERLHKRNEYFFGSHHPLRDALIEQIGRTVSKRVAFLQNAFTQTRQVLVHEWEPEFETEAPF